LQHYPQQDKSPGGQYSPDGLTDLADEYLVSNATPVSSGVDPTHRRLSPPPAKHSTLDYYKTTVYVHRDLLDPVGVWLSHQGLETSVLSERLLATWLIAKSPHEVKIG